MGIRRMMGGIGIVVAVSSVAFGFPVRKDESSPAPAVVVKGLAMVQLQNPEGLRIALPDAPGHRATITFVMADGSVRVFPFKGSGVINTVETATASTVVNVPELVRISELYGPGTKSLVGRAKNILTIPWSSIRKVSTEEVTAARYTFVRKDSGEDIASFRPRQVAESVRIDLTSMGAIAFNRATTPFNSDVRLIKVEHVPQSVTSDDPVQQHFHHYLHYFVRPSASMFDVVPRKVSGRASVAPRLPRFAQSFRIDEYIWCWLIAID